MKERRPSYHDLVEKHLNCVHWVIGHYIAVNEGVCGLGYDDLYQEGCMALCRAAASYNPQNGAQFHSYAISVIRNYLIDYCRHIQTQRSYAQVVSLEELREDSSREPSVSYDDTNRLYAEQLLAYGKRTYNGTARLGIEALELKIQGYSGTEIAKFYGVKPNLVGAWISRAAAKLKKDAVIVENGGANS